MVEKKEVQETIVQDKKSKEEELIHILKMVAPGTHLRASLDGALKTGRGALIVIENELVTPILDGGFRINARFTPQRLVELSKLDGAIVLSHDLKKINYVNVLLTPDHKIKSTETGTRHKAAERTAKQTGTLVIAISERKHEITIFSGKIRYPLMNTDELLRKTNQNIQILEKQREGFDRCVSGLTRIELRNQPSLNQALNVIQKGMMVQKINEDLKKNIVELGKESILLKMRMRELISGVEKETDLVIKDYTKVNVKKSKEALKGLSFEELMTKEDLLGVLAYESESLTEPVRGWRILSKTTLPEPDIALLIKSTGSLGAAIHSGIILHQEILGEEKAELFKNEINKIKVNSY